MTREQPGRIAGAQQGLYPAIHALVLDALTKGPGETLATSSEFRERLGVGAGTLQRALDLLAERGALRTVSRGHLGRLISSVEVGPCWQAAGLDPVRVALSPSGPIELDVLESTLASELTALGIPHTVAHVRGGAVRLAGVAAGAHDLTVVSAGTFQGVRASAETPAGSSRELEPGTYYAPSQLVVVALASQKRAPMRVAIDSESFDHAALTRAEFPVAEGVEFVEVPFPEVLAHVLGDLVDAGVWHITASPIPPELAGLELRQLQRAEAIAVRDTLSAAAIVSWHGRPELRSVISALSLQSVPRDQQRALAEQAAAAARFTSADRST